MIKARTLQDLFKRYRRPGDLVYSWISLAVSLFLLVNLPGETTWTENTKLFAQAAFWPYFAVCAMVLFSLLHLASSLMSERIAGRWQEVWFWVKSAEYAGWFMLYALLVPVLGYLPATVVFAIALTARLGYRGYKYLGTAALYGVVVVFIFKTLLQVKVPGGEIYEYLPTTLRSFMLTYF